jgi:hypothetical protein
LEEEKYCKYPHKIDETGKYQRKPFVISGFRICGPENRKIHELIVNRKKKVLD